MTDPWMWWQQRLAGMKVHASEGTPHAGFYRAVRKTSYGGTKWAVPIAYWPDPEDGELNCREGVQDVSRERGDDIWVNVHNNPVPEDWYREVAEDDASEWRDGMYAVPPPGDNQPPPLDIFIDLQDIITSEAEMAKELLEGPPITEQTEADKISNLADHLTKLWKEADEARKGERKPHDEALLAIQQKWSPLLLAAETYKNLKRKLLTPWQEAQEDAQKREAEAAAATGAPALEQSRRPRAGTRSRAMTLKSFKSAEIVDFEECLNHFKNHEAVHQIVQDLANKAVRVGIAVPGARMIEERRTV